MRRRQGFRWKRTRYSLKNRPQPAYHLVVEQLERFQLAAQRGEMGLPYFDESGFNVNPVLRYAWRRAGGQKAVFRQRHTKRFNVLGCLLHGELAWQGLWVRLNGAALVFFMNELVKRLRRRTVAVLGNASMHHARLLKSDKAQWQARGLEFFYLSACSPELNRIEGMWKQVKYCWYPFVEATELELENRTARILNKKGDAYAMNLVH